MVEDILDSGNTLAFLTDYLRTKGAASVTIATLLDKPARREKRGIRTAYSLGETGDSG